MNRSAWNKAASIAAGATCLAGMSIGASARPIADDAERSDNAQSNADDAGVDGLLSVEEVLAHISEASGYSFVFDSRLVRGKQATPLDVERPSERRLRAWLESVDLSLHRLNDRSFAITAAPAKPAPAPFIVPAIAAPALNDAIIVTGTRVASVADTVAIRQFELYEDFLANQNVLGVEEAIYDLPQTLASVTSSNTALLGATAGVNLADLRGLGPVRTQVLVDGRPTTLTAGGNGDVVGYDLNGFAEPFLERIEVETGPSGARRGPNGVAGAINFVLRKDVTGVEGGLRFGVSELGDAEEIAFHALAGGEVFSGAARVSGGVRIARSEGLVGADRDATATPFGFARRSADAPDGAAVFAPNPDGAPAPAPGLPADIGFDVGFVEARATRDDGAGADAATAQETDLVFSPGFGGSAVTGVGSITGVRLMDGSIVAPPGAARLIPSGGAVVPFDGSLGQLFNWSAELSTVLPLERSQAYASIDMEVSPRITVSGLARGGYSATDGRLAPLPAGRFLGVDPAVGDAAVIDLSSPTIPDGVRATITDAFGGDAEAIVFDHRYTELGPRRQRIDRIYAELTTSANVDLEARGDLAIHYRFGQTRTNASETGRVDRARLQTALDQTACAGVAGCAPVDFFDPRGLSDDAIAFIEAPALERRFRLTDHDLSAEWTTAFENDARVIDVRAGGGVRRTRFVDQDLSPADMEFIGGSAPSGLSGASGAVTSVDIVGGATFRRFANGGEPDRFAASLDLRLTMSPQHDLAHNVEAGLDWRVTDKFSLFSRHHFGERPPTAVELFSVGESVFQQTEDPCANLAGNGESAAELTCLQDGALGVTAGFAQDGSLARQGFFGNPDLRSEDVRSDAYGAAYQISPQVFGADAAVEFNLTWFNYRIRNAVAAPADPLANCYGDLLLSNVDCGVNALTGEAIIRRNPTTRQLAGVDFVLRNGAELSWRGLDAELRASFEPAGDGLVDRIWLTALHTYTDRVLSTSLAGATEELQGFPQYPRHGTFAAAGAQSGQWSIGAFVTRRGAIETLRDGAPENRVPAVVYADANIRYRVSDDLYIQLNVDNLTNRRAPIVPFAENSNTFPQFYDVIGRRYAVQARFRF